MAIATVSLDTATRQVVLTVNGVLVPAHECSISKSVWDGKKEVAFSYTLENVDGNGMKERRQFYLPSPEELAVDAHAELDDKGFASKILHDDEQAKADVIDFLHKRRT